MTTARVTAPPPRPPLLAPTLRVDEATGLPANNTPAGRYERGAVALAAHASRWDDPIAATLALTAATLAAAVSGKPR